MKKDSESFNLSVNHRRSGIASAPSFLFDNRRREAKYETEKAVTLKTDGNRFNITLVLPHH